MTNAVPKVQQTTSQTAIALRRIMPLDNIPDPRQL
jgi:hypothetical protein